MSRTSRRSRAALAALLLACPALAAAAEVSGRVVDPSGSGVRDAVVFVQTPPPGVSAPPERRTAVMDQIDKAFAPRVLPIAAGTEVSFPNHDQIHHHVYSFSRAKSFELPLYKGEMAPPVLFDAPGAVKVGCNIHDWMSGVILVLPTPYFVTTDDSGAFTLRDLPPGPTALVAWHENSRTKAEDTQQQVDVGAGTPRLTFTLDVTARRPPPAAHGVRSYE